MAVEVTWQSGEGGASEQDVSKTCDTSQTMLLITSAGLPYVSWPGDRLSQRMSLHRSPLGRRTSRTPAA